MESNPRVVSDWEIENFLQICRVFLHFELKPESTVGKAAKKYAEEHLGDGKDIEYHVKNIWPILGWAMLTDPEQLLERLQFTSIEIDYISATTNGPPARARG